MTFDKQHLQLEDYNWISPSMTARTSSPSRCVFNPKDGEQVLFIINCFVESVGGNISADKVPVIEKMIRQMPSDIRSEKAAFNWLTGYYLYSAF